MNKRAWVYALPPVSYEISCAACGSNNITWSEYDHMIYCYVCKTDNRGNEGIFGGPIPVEVSKMLLGEICFDRIIIETMAYERCKNNDKGLYWEHLYYIQPNFTTA